jgi:hypothetical protein
MRKLPQNRDASTSDFPCVRRGFPKTSDYAVLVRALDFNEVSVTCQGFAKERVEVVEQKKMKLGSRILIVIGIVIVVLVGGGAGAYATFHSNPAFCNFICHTPMDPYVESYQNGTSVNTVQASSDAVLSVTLHKDSDQQLNCLSCHVPDMGEQITEGIKWVTGDYEVPLEMGVASKQIKEDSGDKNGVEFCLRSGCHEGIAYDGSADDKEKAIAEATTQLQASTADQQRNPHNSHMGVPDCSNCHQTHEQSVLICTQCHNDIELPDGWLTYKEQQDQKKQLTTS